MIGSLCDYTRHRLMIWKASYVANVILTSLWAIIDDGATADSTWLYVVVLMLVSAFCVDAGQTAESAYLPELSKDPMMITKLAAQGISTLHVFEIAFTVLIFALNVAAGFTGVAGVRCACIFGAAWMGIFAWWSLGKMRPRAAAQQLPPGTSVFTAGYYVLRSSVRGIWSEYPMVFRFLMGQMLLSAAVGAVISLATVFMVSYLEVTFTWPVKIAQKNTFVFRLNALHCALHS